MFFIIVQGEKGRRIKGGFKIYGSGDDLISIARQIKDTVQQGNISQGWVEIVDETPNQPAIEEWES